MLAACSFGESPLRSQFIGQAYSLHRFQSLVNHDGIGFETRFSFTGIFREFPLEDKNGLNW
jgi:hypothetical protein